MFTRAGFDEADRTAGIRHARAAIASGADDATALAFAAFAISALGKDHEAALGAVDRALALNASCAAAHYVGALIQATPASPPPPSPTPTARCASVPSTHSLAWATTRSGERRS